MSKYKKILRVEMAAFPKPRPRVVKKQQRGKKPLIMTFMPKKYQEQRDEFKRQIGKIVIPDDKAYSLTVNSFRQIPKSWSIAKKAEMKGQWCQSTPDLDNMIGGIMDSLPWPGDNGDKLVVKMTGEKRWSDRANGSPYCVIVIEEV